MPHWKVKFLRRAGFCMCDPKEELTKSWLLKAKRDLLSADELAGADPLAVEFRYPGDYVEPDADEYREAYEAAVKVYKFVLQKLPSVVHS